MEKRRYQIFANSDKETVVADFTISAPSLTGAEQNIVILGADSKAVAVIQLQPGFDRREVELNAAQWPNE